MGARASAHREELRGTCCREIFLGAGPPILNLFLYLYSHTDKTVSGD